MKIIRLSLLILLAGAFNQMALAQKTATIEVKGEASLKVKPDLAVVTVTFSSTDMVFNKAVKDVNAKNETLMKQLEASGFKKEEIKSSRFTANKNIVWTQDKQVDKGYIATQSVILEFVYSKERVTKLVDSFSESTIGLEFNFNFILSEGKTKEVKNKLIALAIQDAKEKASLIASTSVTKLGLIQSIQYGHREFNGPQPMYKSMDAYNNANANTGFGGMNVADIELTDDLTVIWNIEQ